VTQQERLRRIAVRVERPLDGCDFAAMKVACLLAVRHGAHVEALAYETDVLSPAHPRGDAVEADVQSALETLAREHGASLSVHARANFAEGIGETFAALVQVCDIGVLGVPDRPTPAFGMIKTVALFDGGPIVFAPQGFDPGAGLKRIILAWKPGAAASRALKAAVAIAGAETELIVVEVEEPGVTRRAHSGLEAVHFATAHGVSARLEVAPTQGRSVLAALTGAADGFGADLIACGVVRHDLVHNALFGSLTKDLFDAGIRRPMLLAS
jgi:nucleotide-binding universal stress UspA family protein